MNFPIIGSVLETYSRHVKVGDSEAWCGASFMVAIVRPFTAGEDAIGAWLTQQDSATLLEIVPLSDGRDYVVLRREHVKQSFADALREQELFVRSKLWS